MRGVYYGWWVLGAISVLGSISAGLFAFSNAVFLPPIRRDLNISSAQASLIFGSTRAQASIAGPIVGSMIDRLGARPMILVGGVMAGLGLVLLHWIDSYLPFFLIWLGLVSVGRSVGLGPVLVAVMNTWFLGRRSLAASLLSVAFASGGVLILPLVTLGVHTIGWQDVMLYAGVLVIVTTTSFGMVIRRSPESMGIELEGTGRTHARDTNLAGAATGEVAPDYSVAEAVRTSTFWVLLLASVLKLSMWSAISIHAVEMMVTEGMDEKTAGFMLSLMFLLSIPLRLVVGIIGVRFPVQLILSSGTAAGGLAALSLLGLDGNLAIYLFVGFMAIEQGTDLINWVALGNFFGRKRFATLSGITLTCVNAGMLLSPIYAGWIFDRTDSYQWALITFAPLYAIGAVLYLTVRRPSQPNRPVNHSTI